MADYSRNEGDSLLKTSQLENADSGNHPGAASTSKNETQAPPQDTLSLPDGRERLSSSAEIGDSSENHIPENLHEAAPAADLPDSSANDSTAHLTPSTAQEPSPPVVLIPVSSTEVPARPHEGRPHGGHPHGGHPHGGRPHGGRPHGGHPHGGHHGKLGRQKASRSLRHMLVAWKFELGAGLLAIAILVCEIVLLAHYDDKFLLYHWPHDWKINAVFAFLTTFLEAAILFYVGACIGQLRWYWFKKKQHRLEWLEILTEARQPPGAVRLLLRPGMQRQFVALGALIVVLLLGVSTFTQNVITAVIEPHQLGPATGFVPINTNYSWRDTDTSLRLGTQQPLPQMVAAIQNGFYSFSTNERSLGVSAWMECRGDTCDFGRYQSIAVCSKCADISSEVVNPCPNKKCTNADYYTLKNGINLSLAATNGVVNLTADTKFPTNPELSSTVGPLIVRFHALVADGAGTDGTGTGASALECAAWWCVKMYSGRVVNGTLREDLRGEWTDKSVGARTSYLQERDITLNPPQCLVNNTTPTNQSYCTFTAGSAAQVALQNFLAVRDSSTPFEPFLTGSAVYHGRGAQTTWNYTSLLAGGLVSSTTGTNHVLDEIDFGFTKMAEQMTVSIRGEIASDYSSEYSYGTAFNREQMFHVRWGWLAYPIAIVVASLAFLIGTIIKTRNHEVWKSSILPMVFHAFGGDDHEQFVKLETIEEMKAVSRGRKMYLGGDAGGHSVFKAGATAPEHGMRYKMGEKTAAGFSEVVEAIPRTVEVVLEGVP